MTREEAIHELGEWLEQMIQHGVPSHSAKRKALATAIALLSAVCDDCIWHVCNYNKIDWDALSAEAVQGWIPCSERLPDDDGDYLVWLEDESDHYAVVYFDTGADAFGWWVDHYDPITLGFIETDFCEAKNITAWQPLPTPYKGGEDE